MGYTYAYPYELPPGGGGVSAVALDSKGNLWAFQRNAVGKPQVVGCHLAKADIGRPTREGAGRRFATDSDEQGSR